MEIAAKRALFRTILCLILHFSHNIPFFRPNPFPSSSQWETCQFFQNGSSVLPIFCLYSCMQHKNSPDLFDPIAAWNSIPNKLEFLIKQSKIQIILHEKGLKNRCRYSKIEKMTSKKGGLCPGLYLCRLTLHFCFRNTFTTTVNRPLGTVGRGTRSPTSVTPT